MPLSPKVREFFEKANELTALETDETVKILGSSVTEDNITVGSFTELIVKTLRGEPRDPEQHEHEEHRRGRRRHAEAFSPHSEGLRAVAESTGLSQS